MMKLVQSTLYDGPAMVSQAEHDRQIEDFLDKLNYSHYTAYKGNFLRKSEPTHGALLKVRVWGKVRRGLVVCPDRPKDGQLPIARYVTAYILCPWLFVCLDDAEAGEETTIIYWPPRPRKRKAKVVIPQETR